MRIMRGERRIGIALNVRRSAYCVALVVFARGANGDEPLAVHPTESVDATSGLARAVSFVGSISNDLVGRAIDWYRLTPPIDRMIWSGLFVIAAVGLGVLFDRLWRLRQSRVLPAKFVDRFVDRLQDVPFDRAKALDLCELSSSPASRVAMSALSRSGRPISDLERCVARASKQEVEGLTRSVGTLKRLAMIAPLIGLLGSLQAASRALGGLEGAEQAAIWGPIVASSLAPLTMGVVLALIALIAFDGLMVRVERLGSELDRFGGETIDIISTAHPYAESVARGDRPNVPRAPACEASPRATTPRHQPHFGPTGPHRGPRVRREENPQDLMEF
jgi:biopolymer transport protein ExbB